MGDWVLFVGQVSCEKAGGRNHILRHIPQRLDSHVELGLQEEKKRLLGANGKPRG